MRTRIAESKLMELRVLGFHSISTFTDPHVIAQCKKVLTERGEQWAASVLGRDLARRSIAVPNMPFLRNGEEYTLVLADAEEDIAKLGEARP